MPSQMSRLTYGEVRGEIGDPEKYRIYSSSSFTHYIYLRLFLV